MTKEQKIFTAGAIATGVGAIMVVLANKFASNLHVKSNTIVFWLGIALAIGGVITMISYAKYLPSLPSPSVNGNDGGGNQKAARLFNPSPFITTSLITRDNPLCNHIPHFPITLS